ncbi:sensor histidine kinase [Streptomyces sp. NL15-2K]|uniref:sensor histidine kinase n=1 Tax=Streptomyces sp. NL15-2K TaxID=376149 RepID=UPI000F588472|nr:MULTISPECIES: histidine kinase [Actinomycetes]WKX06957.1 histidine kinase [Kutzneria buriramensis]
MGELRRRLRPDHAVDRGPAWVLLDVVVAYLSAVIAVGPSDHTASAFAGPGSERACAVVWFAAIAGRRFAPACALWAGGAATVAAVGSGAEVTNVSLATALALTLVVQTRPAARALECAAPPALAAVAVLAADDNAFVPALAVHAVAWLVGRTGRARRETRDALRAHERAQAVAAERARMASELHDAVGHAVTVMVTHAGAARLTLGADAPDVRQALSRIEEVGRGAMTDLDRILGLLTDTYDVEATLRALVARLPDDVTADLRLPAPDLLGRLPVEVAETVGRVVQESLTNVVRHARPAHAVVGVDLTGDRVAVHVTDDGTGAPGRSPGGPPGGPAGESAGGGRGLRNMLERLARLGGTLDTGPAAGGGWRVAAVIPLNEPVAPPKKPQAGSTAPPVASKSSPVPSKESS